ncbi:MAG TPA: hypothetical protein VK858_07560 [Longimicrobiales bacterium]|nr:hypothetical protein [Longimicrobiales bacterium]
MERTTPSGATPPRRAWVLGLCLAAACGPSGDEGAEVSVDVDAEAEVGNTAEVRSPTLRALTVGTSALLQAVSAPSARVVWLSGHQGTWVRSVDGGDSWVTGVVAGLDTLQFRDVHAFDADTALLLSAGTGALSRIVRTTDGGATWSEVFRMDHPDGFLDCMDFWDARRGLAYGDAVDGELYLLATDDGGRTWDRVPPATLPAALDGEGGFAASGTCVATEPPGRAWIATGNGTSPRLLRTEDGGASWTVRTLPLAAGPARGPTTVDFRPDGMGFALGGDLDPEGTGPRVALSADRGATWSAMGDLALAGAVYGAAWVPDRDPATLVAVGPGGIDVSTDGGMSWVSADTLGHWAVGFASAELGWAVGPLGRVTEIRIRP